MRIDGEDGWLFVREAALIRSRQFWLLIGWSCLCITVFAQEGRHLHRADGIAPFRYWDNLEHLPHWLGGDRPGYNRDEGLHTVRLEPGSYILIRLPARQGLRLLKMGDPWIAEELRLELSNGSALFLETPMQAGIGKSWSVEPSNGGDRLVRLSRPGHYSDPIEVALFISRSPSLPNLADYRSQPDIKGDLVQMQGPEEPTPRSVWRVGPTQEIETELAGPQRLQMESWLRYETVGSESRQIYHLHVELDGVNIQTRHQYGRANLHRKWRVDGCERVLGVVNRSYLDIPEGRHRLKIGASAPLLLRLRGGSEQGDFLIAENRPKAPADIPGRYESASDEITRLGALARDNRLSGSGSAALGAALRLSEEERLLPEIAAEARAMDSRHGFFRPLLPVSIPESGGVFVRWPAKSRLRWDQETPLLIPQTLADSLAKGVSGRIFLILPDREDRAYHYALPKRRHDSRLQLLISDFQNGNEGELFLQFDDEPPKRLRLKPGLPLPQASYWPDASTAAHRLSPSGTAGFPVLTSVADLELPLPAEISTLRIWQSAENPQPLDMALGMRVAGHLATNEAEYLPLISDLDSAEHDRLMRESMGAIPQLAESRTRLAALLGDGNGSKKEALLNDWLPLLRFLYARYATFMARVERPMPVLHSSPTDEDNLERSFHHAEEAMRDRDWIRAVEAWSDIIPDISDRQRNNALMQRVTALTAMGEGNLSELLLRGMLIHEADPQLSEQAAAALEKIYMQNRDDQGLLNLLVTRAVLDPQPGRLAKLAGMLLKQGKAVWAIKILLSIPPNRRPTGRMLDAAYSADWWRTFAAYLSRLADPQLQAYWRGYRHQRQGRYDAALSAWEDAGPHGTALSNALRQGLSIRSDLTDPEMDQEALLEDWAAWWEKLPGERQWRSLINNIVKFDGVEMLNVPDQDQTFRLFRALPSSPVEMVVQGPRTLRINTRLLHSEEIDFPVDDWLLVADGSSLRRFPVNGDSVVKGVRLSRGGMFPGRTHRFEYSIGPGRHHLKLTPHDRPQLIEVEALSAERPLSVLPEPMAYDLGGKPGVTGDFNPRDLFPGQDVRWLKGCTAIDSAMPAPQGETISGDDSVNAEVAGIPRPLYTVAVDQDEHYRQMTQWLWQAEQQPEKAVSLLAQAEVLFHAHASDRRLQGIIRRMRHNYRWQPMDGIVSSAGLRFIRLTTFQPESPGSRVRSALLEPLLEDERFIYGGQRVNIALRNPASATTVALSFKLEEIGYIDARELQISYRLDDGESHLIRLTPDHPDQRIHLSVPQGQHVLRVQMLDPLQNQILRFAIRDEGQSPGADRERFYERAYQVSTVDEPVELALEGPAWLRVDERVEGQTISRFLFIQPGWQALQLPPRSGRQESYYRLFRQRVLQKRWQSRLREVHLIQAEMPIADKIPSTQTEALPLRELQPMSGQEDGTWEYYGRLVSRRNLDEDRSADQSERFFELGVGHRLFQEYADRYLESGVLARFRDIGGTTLGAFGDLHWDSGFHAISLGLSGDLFLQQPKQAIGTEWSLLLKAKLSQYRRLSNKTHHRPSFGLFNRWLSLGGLEQGLSEYVDQDIYTRYKDDHQRGLRLSDTLSHHPWRDTRIRASLALTTNEALNPFRPDYTDLTLSGDQLVRDLGLGVRYRWRHYFDDDDRADEDHQHNLKLRLDWRRWKTLQAGWHLAFELDHELDSGDTSLFLNLRHHRANGRLYRDFRPGTVTFEPLRSRHELERYFPVDGVRQ
ncbi:MAG: hypothetical protein AB2764_16850 [Candidatus Thiodiazotropha endolucinida]